MQEKLPMRVVGRVALVACPAPAKDVPGWRVAAALYIRACAWGPIEFAGEDAHCTR
jgi:hypothetical protein